MKQQDFITNDFSIRIATPNGSGSQTANGLILRALFKMGIPVSAKNLLPSNIEGEPTWFTIRCSHQGYNAYRHTTDILVAMNPRTALDDVRQLKAGSVCLYPEDMPISFPGEGVIGYPMPVKELAARFEVPPKQRKFVANMVYVGVLTQLLAIEPAAVKAALERHFRGDGDKVSLNLNVIQAARQWAQQHLTKVDPYRVQRMSAPRQQVMLDGNTAAALGAIYGGASFVAWYPITPSTGLADALTTYLGRLRCDPNSGEQFYAVLQAEDELAAIGMVLGAGWAGARAMTCTSGPGISLMAELVGYGYFAEIPAVIWDVQRMGPSTGLPTRVSQGDLLFAHILGHGDSRHVCLLPGNIAECFEFGWRAFDLAERLQTPILVLSDLDLGINPWMSPPFDYPPTDMDRGKVLTAAEVERCGFARYEDRDGDGIAYRTWPGTDHPGAAYFTRGSGHDAQARLSERPQDWEANSARLERKWQTARQLVPAPVIKLQNPARLGVIAFGSTDPAIGEAADYLAASGVHVSYLRLRALPLVQAVRAFLEAHERVYVVELNTDGQLHQLLRMAYPDLAGRLVSLRHNNGLPITAAWVVENILAGEGGRDDNP